MEDLKIKRLFFKYKQREYFYNIRLYKEEYKTDEEIIGLFIKRGFPVWEVEEAIIEYNDFIKGLKYTEIL